MSRFRTGRIVLLAAALLSSACHTADAVVDDATATCRAALSLQTRSFADTVLAKIIGCARDRMRGKLAADTACDDLTAATFPGRSASTIADAVARLTSRVAASCADVSPATLGYTTCPSPCDATVPALSGFADVAACLICQAEQQSETLVATLYGATPPIQSAIDAAERCQDTYVATRSRAYVHAVLQARKTCQAKVDAGTLSSVDCAVDDPSGAAAMAGKQLDASVAKCTAQDLAALTSCASSVAGEQSCVADAGDAMASALFALMRPSSGGSGSSCAADSFLDLSSAPGAGAGYAKPTLSASCTDTEVMVSSNSIPPYTFVQTTPNALVVNQLTYHFPRTPAVAASTTSVPLLNSIAVAVNGLPIFGPNEAALPDPYGDPVANAILDECMGHTAYVYHYHALVVKCLTQAGLVAEPWLLDDPPTDQPSPIIGYAFDGFPIYGPYGCVDAACSQVVEFLSSWDNTGYESVDCSSTAQCSANFTCALAMIDGTARNACVPKTYAWTNNAYHAKSGSQYLDQCNGHYGPDGGYHYHATSTFPYILGCYSGTPTTNTGH
jgi:hypothetical protein